MDRRDDSASLGASVAIPSDTLARVQALCEALPEVTLRVDETSSAERSTAYSYEVRGRSFCLLVARRGPAGAVVPLLVLRAEESERAALLAGGGPFFEPRGGRDRVGLLLVGEVDWDEVRELVTDSYRVLVPKKLSARLD